MRVFTYMTYASMRSKRMLARVFAPTCGVLRLSNSCDFDEMAKRHQRRNDAFRTIVSKGGVRARFDGNVSPKSLQRFSQLRSNHSNRNRVHI